MSMSQVYAIIAIVGFSLAAVLAVAAVVMFFTLHIKQVRDDLTGKTAARSIAEIRSRAKTRKRTASAAVKGLGWERGVSSGALDAFAVEERAGDAGRVRPDDGEAATSLLVDEDDEPVTSLLAQAAPQRDGGGADDEPATSLLAGAALSDADDGEASTTLLAQPASKKAKLPGAGTALGLVLAAAIAGLTAFAAPADALGSLPKPEIVKPAAIAGLADAAPNGSRIGGLAGLAGSVSGLDARDGASEPIKLSLKAELGELEVPYGVDIAAYLSAQDLFACESDPTLEHDGIAALFVDGEILALAPGATYPQPGDPIDLTGLAWGTLVDHDATLEGGDLSALSAKAGQIEGWLFDGVSVGDLDGDEVAARMTGAQDDAVFWANARMRLDSADPSHAFSFIASKGDEPAPGPDAFDPVATGVELPDPADADAYPAAVYARAAEDAVYREGAPDEQRIAKGQIVRLPLVKFDGEAPACDGAARLEGGTPFAGMLFARSVLVHATCTDDADASGLASATLEYGSNPLTAVKLAKVDLEDPKRGASDVEFPFLFATDGLYDAGDLYVGIADIAGNAARVRLDALKDGAGAAFDPALWSIVLSSLEPQVSLSYEDDPDDVAGFYRARTAVVRVVDDNYDALRERYDAMTPEEQAAVAPVLSFVNDALPADDPGRTVTVGLGDLVTANGVHEARLRLEADGAYRLADASAPTYQGMIPSLGSTWAAGSDTAPFAIDLTAPEAGRVSVGPGSNVQEGLLFVAGEATVEFALDDDASGIDASSVKLVSAGEEQVVSFRGDGARGGTAVWRIPADDALVDLSQVSLSFADRLGNGASIDDLAAYADKNLDVEGIVADGAAPVFSVAFDNDDGAFGSFYRAPRTATVTLVEASFPFVRAHDPDRAVVTRFFDGAVSTVPATAFENPSGDGVTWAAEVPCAADGTYRIEADFTDPSGRQAAPYRGEEFTVDTTAPTTGRVVFSPDAPVHWGWLFAPGEASVAFALDDALVGVEGSSVDVALTGATGPVGAVAFEGDGARGGTATWSLPADDALIDLSRASLSYADRLGNAGRIGNLRDYADKSLDIKGIVADSAAPVIAVSFDNDDARNGKYYNAPRTATVAVEEATFGFVRANDPDRAVAVRHRNGEALPVQASEFENPSGDGVTWTAPIPCAEDGVYRIDVDFTDPSGKAAEPYRGEEFVVDTVAPTPGAVSIAPHTSVAWEWLFAPSGIAVGFSVADELSGIDESTVAVAAGGEPASAGYRPDGADALGGTVTWDVPADDRAIDLAVVSLSFADRAGNVARIGSLGGYENRDLDVAGILADSAAPVISVAFDNDDARNGRYYPAPRTATVTVEEATFGFVRARDPYRVVVTRHLNDSVLTVPAEDFENPSGDGVTWTAQVPCDTDGVYRIEADFTDPSGKAAEPYRGEEFVVDLTKPLIMATFDNNSAEGGGYFKAPRTATVVVYDDNFSEELTPVAVAASDASGNAVAAPGIGGWSEAPRGTWTARVPFADELHYSMSVTCTDLAGNVADPVEEPEFVIDMTPPVVKVAGVADRAAYKDRVAPSVSFEDTNFEPFLTDVGIVGAVRGDKAYFAYDDAAAETSRSVEFADFPYELEVDDVYTLTATVKDKAGNESQEAVTFSVNRFGSNYELSASAASLVGSYVKRGETVSVTETNVSGLESSSASIAHNDVVETLASGSDYAVEEDGGQDTWSRYTYTFPAELFEQDGYYRVMLASRDAAGSLSENLMEGKNGDRSGPLELSFAVDGTAPVASLGNVGGSSAYYAPSQRVDAYAGDNMEAREAVLTVDGEPVRSWDAEALAAERAFSYDLPAAEGARDVRLEVTDRAGNTATVSAENVIVTNNLSRYVLNTPAILYPIIAGAVVALSGGVLAAMRLANRRAARRGGPR